MARKCNLADAQNELKPLLESWDQCLGCLSRYRSKSSIARKSFHLLSMGAGKLIEPICQPRDSRELGLPPQLESEQQIRRDVPAERYDSRVSINDQTQRRKTHTDSSRSHGFSTVGPNSVIQSNSSEVGQHAAAQLFHNSLAQQENITTDWAQIEDLWSGDVDLGSRMPYVSVSSEFEHWMFDDQSLQC